MATAQQVINRIGGILRIVDAPGSAVDSTTSADMLTVLADWISQQGEDGVLDIPAPTALSDTIDVSPGTIRAIAYNVAIDYADYIGKSEAVTQRTTRQAMLSMSRLVGKSTITRQVDFGADGMPSASRGRYNINTDA